MTGKKADHPKLTLDEWPPSNNDYTDRNVLYLKWVERWERTQKVIHIPWENLCCEIWSVSLWSCPNGKVSSESFRWHNGIWECLKGIELSSWSLLPAKNSHSAFIEWRTSSSGKINDTPSSIGQPTDELTQSRHTTVFFWFLFYIAFKRQTPKLGQNSLNLPHVVCRTQHQESSANTHKGTHANTHRLLCWKNGYNSMWLLTFCYQIT